MINVFINSEYVGVGGARWVHHYRKYNRLLKRDDTRMKTPVERGGGGGAGGGIVAGLFFSSHDVCNAKIMIRALYTLPSTQTHQLSVSIDKKAQ